MTAFYISGSAAFHLSLNTDQNPEHGLGENSWPDTYKSWTIVIIILWTNLHLSPGT